MLRTKIKAGSITNLTDARYFAAWEVEWLGFNFDSGADSYISPQVMKAIREWIDGPKIVGEFNLHTAEEIAEAVGLLSLDAIQAGMFTEAATLIELKPSVPVIKEIVIEKAGSEDDLREALQAFTPPAQFFLLNFDKNGVSWQSLKQGKPFSIDFLTGLCLQYPIMLSIDLDPVSVVEILDTLPLIGLNVAGGEEERVGFKSFDELDEIFEAIAG
jgi:phosphoribosylanthranilate isomerase